MYEDFYKIKDSVEKELIFNDLTIKDLTLRLPALKHFWVARLIEFKIENKSLNNKKSDAIKKIKYNSEDIYRNNINLSKDTLLKTFNNSPEVLKINERIEELELIIEYLEKVEKVFSQASFDLKNAIELIKMEQM